MEIRLYKPPGHGDLRFVPVAVTNAAHRLTVSERFFAPGSFEVFISSGAAAADKFEKYLFALIDRSFWGVILSISRSADSGGDVLAASGLCLKGLMSSRVTAPPGFTYEQVGGVAGFDVADGSTETCMKHFVASNFFQASAPTRGIPGLEIAPDKNRGKPDDRYMTRFEPLSGVLEELGRGAGIGYSVAPDLADGKLVFDCIEGVDRSAGQSENHRVIFEIERKNVAAMSYQDSDMNMRNLFYASLSGSQFADDTYTATVTRGDGELPNGIHRWEQHLDISASHPVPGKELDELRRLAAARAESYAPVSSFDAEILDTTLKYGVDYRLGDIVTVRHRGWGLAMNTRLTEMETVAADGGVALSATFGDAPLNFISRLRRQIKGG